MMRSVRTLLLILLGTLLLFGCTNGGEPGRKLKPNEPFTIVVLPDTQYYHMTPFIDIFIKQTQWIKDNQKEMKIVAAIHLGDITDNNNENEWEESDTALSILDNVVPLFLVPGNHDTGPGGRMGTIETEFLDEYFPPSRFKKKAWFGGVFEEKSIKNAYYYLQAGDVTFIIVCLEFGPRDEALDWAGKILSEHEDKKAIIVTHCYMNHDDTRVGPDDSYNPHNYKHGDNDGEEIWDKLVRKHENIVFVLSGHILGDGTGRQTSVGDNGNEVHEILSNYQMDLNGGWLRIMRFVPDENKVYVTTYSPYQNKYKDDPENKFTLDFEMK
jgi:hypothetical protein